MLNPITLVYPITLVISLASVAWSFFSPLWAWCPLVIVAFSLLVNLLRLKRRKWWPYVEELSPSANQMLQNFGHFYSMPLSSRNSSAAVSCVQIAGVLVAIIGAVKVSWWLLAVAVVWWLILNSIAAFYNPTLFLKAADMKTAHEEAIAWATNDDRRSVLVRAMQGEAEAQFAVGVVFHESADGPDYVEAAKWYRLAAEQGNADAQFWLGSLYVAGKGFPQDYAEAVKWFRRAAEQGHDDAQLMLGVHYVHGDGLPQDHGEAAKWYRLAAEQGNWRAQFDLGLIYASQGTPQAHIRAHTWLNLNITS